MIRISAFFVFLVWAASIFSQSNTINHDLLKEFDQGIKYLNDKNFKQAYSFFEAAAKVKSHPQFTDELYRSEANFYKAFSSVKLGLSNAENDLLSLYQSLNTNRKNQAAFLLAEFYFDKENFKESEEWFVKVPVESLSNDVLEDYYFKSAYSAMENGKQDTALNRFNKLLEISKGKYLSETNYYIGILYFNKKEYVSAEKYLSLVKSNSNTEDVNYILAQIQFSKKNYPQVIKLLDKDQSGTKGINQLLGKSYFEIKDFEKAITYLYKHLGDVKQVNPEDMYQLAYSEYKVESYKDAIEHFKELQVSNNFGQYSMYALADCYLKSNDKTNALNAFKLASANSQDAIILEESRFNVAKLQYDLKNYNESIKSFNDFNERYPTSKHKKEAWELTTYSLLHTNNYPQAISIIEKNEHIQEGNEKLYQELCYAQAVNLYKNGDTAAAIKFLNKSIVNPFDRATEAEARYLKADIYYKNNQIDEAMSEYIEAFKIVQKDKLTSNQNANLFNIHYGLGYCEYQKKNYDAALSNFQNCSRNYKPDQNNAPSHLMQDVDLRLADLLFIKKNYDAAYTQYNKIAQQKSKGYDYAIFQRANIDGVKRNYKDKISTLTKLMKEIPNSSYHDDAQYQLGLAYEDDKNYESAIKTYEEIESNTKSKDFVPRALMRLANIYINKNNSDQALTKYSQIAENYSNSPEADAAIKAIKEIFISQEKPDEFLNFMAKLPNSKQLGITEQDSLLFDAGEEQYANENYDKGIILFNKYLDKFPKGLFSSKAHYLKAECYSQKKMYVEAVDEYNYLTENNDNPYYEKAIVKSAYYSYNIQKDYGKSKSLYQKLLSVASSQQNKQLSKIGLLESNYNLKNYGDVIETAKLIEADAEISAEIKADATYYKAKSLFLTKNNKAALPILETLTKDKNSKRGAECTYYLASILHQNGDFKKSNEILLSAKDDYASYEYWVVKYFILIGYNYHKLNDNFQAKATLQSIIENYTGDEDLLKDARNKMAEIDAKIKSGSKVKYK